MRLAVTCLVLVAGCDGLIDAFGGGDDAGPPDASIPLANGWSPAEMVTLDRPAGMFATDPSFTEDQAHVVYAVTALGSTDYDLYEATMTSPTLGGTSKAVLARPGVVEASPEVSPDGLTVYFLAFSGTTGQIERMARAGLTRQWGQPTTPADLNSGADQRPGNVDRTGTRIVIVRGTQLVELANTTGAWVERMTTTALPMFARDPELTADGLTLVYAAPDKASSTDLYVSVRTALDMPWSSGYRMDASDPDTADTDPWLSNDGKRLYFTRGATIYTSTR